MSESWLQFGNSANKFKRTYILDLLDVSGTSIVRNGSFKVLNGNIMCNAITDLSGNPYSTGGGGGSGGTATSLSASTNLTVASIANVTGTSKFTGNVGIGKSSTSNALDVAGATNLSSSLTVSGASIHSGTTVLTGAVGVGKSSTTNALDVAGATNIDSTLTVGGATTLGSISNVSGTSRLTGNVGIGKSSTPAYMLDISGNAHVSSAIIVDGGATLASVTNVAGTSKFTGNVGVGGASSAYKLDVTGTAHVSSTLAVDGATTLASISDVPGTSKLTGNVGVGKIPGSNKLDVGGSVNIDSNLTVGGTSQVTGTSQLMGNVGIGKAKSNVYSLDVSGSTHISNSLIVDGAVTNAGAVTMGSSVAVAGTTTMMGGVGIGTPGTSAYSLAVAGPTNITSTLTTTDLVSSGTSRVAVLGVGKAVTGDKKMDVGGSANIDTDLTVGGDATVTGKSQFTSNVGIGKVADATNILDIAGTTRVTGALNVTGTVDLGATTLASISNVSGVSKFTGGVGIGKDATVGTSLDVLGASTLTGALNVTGATNLGTTTLASIDDVVGSSKFTGSVGIGKVANVALDVAGATTLTGALNVTGATSLSNVGIGKASTTNALDVAGATVLNSTLNVTGNTGLTGTLNVTGATTLTTATLASITDVTGTSKLTGNVGIGKEPSSGSTALDVAGATVLNSTLDVTGATTLANTTMTSITNVTGTSKFEGNVGIGGASGSQNLVVSGTTNITQSATVGGSLLVAGTTTHVNPVLIGPSTTDIGTSVLYINDTNGTNTNGVVLQTNQTVFKSSSGNDTLTIDPNARTIMPNTSGVWNIGSDSVSFANLWAKKVNIATKTLVITDDSGNEIQMSFDAVSGSVNYLVTPTGGGAPFVIKGVQTQKVGSGEKGTIDPTMLEFTGLTFGDTFDVTGAYAFDDAFTYNLSTTTYSGSGSAFTTSATSQSLDSFVTGSNLTTLLALVPNGKSVIIRVGATDGRTTGLSGIDTTGSLVPLSNKIISVYKKDSTVTWTLWNSESYDNTAGNFLHYIELKNINMVSGTYYIGRTEGTLVYNIVGEKYLKTTDLTVSNGDFYLFIRRGPGQNWTRVPVSLPPAYSIKTQMLDNNVITNIKIVDGTITSAKIQDGGINGNKLADESVSSAKLQSTSITHDKLAPYAVWSDNIGIGAIDTSDKLVDGVISTTKLADASVTTGKLADNAVTNDKLADNAVTSLELANNAVISSKISDSAIVTGKINDLAVTTVKIATGAVTADKISDGTITASKFAIGAVTADLFTDGSINSSKMADGAVTTAKIGDLSVTKDKLASNSVDTGKLGDSSVSSAKLIDASVTDTKLANLSVSSGKIMDNAVTTGKIADLNITGAKLANATISTDKVADSAITSSKLADLSIIASKLANAIIDSSKLVDLAVTSGKIASGAITEDKLAVGSVTATKIASLAVDTANIAQLAVTTAKIKDGNITTEKIADGSITALKLAPGAFAGASLPDSSISSSQLANLAVTSTKIADGAIIASKISSGTINADHIGANMITSAKILDGAITSAKMAPTSVGTTILADSSVIEIKIGSSAVTSAKLADDAVTTLKILDANVTASKLSANAVTTNKIMDANITATKLADNAVTTAKIMDANITSLKLADNAVTTLKVADGSITMSKLGTDVISSIASGGGGGGTTTSSGGGGTSINASSDISMNTLATGGNPLSNYAVYQTQRFVGVSSTDQLVVGMGIDYGKISGNGMVFVTPGDVSKTHVYRYDVSTMQFVYSTTLVTARAYSYEISYDGNTFISYNQDGGGWFATCSITIYRFVNSVWTQQSVRYSPPTSMIPVASNSTGKYLRVLLSADATKILVVFYLSATNYAIRIFNTVTADVLATIDISSVSLNVNAHFSGVYDFSTARIAWSDDCTRVIVSSSGDAGFKGRVIVYNINYTTVSLPLPLVGSLPAPAYCPVGYKPILASNFPSRFKLKRTSTGFYIGLHSGNYLYTTDSSYVYGGNTWWDTSCEFMIDTTTGLFGTGTYRLRFFDTNYGKSGYLYGINTTALSIDYGASNLTKNYAWQLFLKDGTTNQVILWSPCNGTANGAFLTVNPVATNNTVSLGTGTPIDFTLEAVNDFSSVNTVTSIGTFSGTTATGVDSNYGTQVDITGDGKTIVFSTGNSNNSYFGAVRLYTYVSDNNWTLVKTFLGTEVSTTPGGFGMDIHITPDGKTLAIGSKSRSMNDRGIIACYRLINNQWKFISNVYGPGTLYTFWGMKFTMSANGRFISQEPWLGGTFPNGVAYVYQISSTDISSKVVSCDSLVVKNATVDINPGVDMVHGIGYDARLNGATLVTGVLSLVNSTFSPKIQLQIPDYRSTNFASIEFKYQGNGTTTAFGNNDVRMKVGYMGNVEPTVTFEKYDGSTSPIKTLLSFNTSTLTLPWSAYGYVSTIYAPNTIVMSASGGRFRFEYTNPYHFMYMGRNDYGFIQYSDADNHMAFIGKNTTNSFGFYNTSALAYNPSGSVPSLHITPTSDVGIGIKGVTGTKLTVAGTLNTRGNIFANNYSQNLSYNISLGATIVNAGTNSDMGSAYSGRVYMSSDGTIMVSSSILAKSIYVYRLTNGAWPSTPTFIITRSEIAFGTYVALSKDGLKIAVSDGTTIWMYVWNAGTSDWVLQTQTITNTVTAITYGATFVRNMKLSGDGSKIAIISFKDWTNSRVYIYNTISGMLLVTLNPFTECTIDMSEANEISSNMLFYEWNRFNLAFSSDASTVMVSNCKSWPASAGGVAIYDINYTQPTVINFRKILYNEAEVNSSLIYAHMGRRLAINANGTVMAFACGLTRYYSTGGLTDSSSARIYIYRRVAGSGKTGWTLSKVYIDTDVTTSIDGGLGVDICLDDTGNTIFISNNSEYNVLPTSTLTRAGAVSRGFFFNGNWSALSTVVGTVGAFFGYGLATNADGTQLAVSEFKDPSTALHGGKVYIYNYKKDDCPISSNGGFVFHTNNTVNSAMTIASTKEVGIGMTPVSGTALSVLGNVNATGSITGASDDRLKENEAFIVNAIDTIMKLRPEIYDKKPEFASTDVSTWERESGLIAQDVWYGAPELRHLVKLGSRIETITEYEAITYPTLVPGVDVSGVEFNTVEEPALIQVDASGNPMMDASGNPIDISGCIIPPTTRILPVDHRPQSKLVSKTVSVAIDPSNIVDIPLSNDIQTDPDYSTLGWGDTPASLNYVGLIPYLIKSIQELKSEIEQQKTIINELQNR